MVSCMIKRTLAVLALLLFVCWLFIRTGLKIMNHFMGIGMKVFE